MSILSNAGVRLNFETVRGEDGGISTLWDGHDWSGATVVAKLYEAGSDDPLTTMGVAIDTGTLAFTLTAEQTAPLTADVYYWAAVDSALGPIWSGQVRPVDVATGSRHAPIREQGVIWSDGTTVTVQATFPTITIEGGGAPLSDDDPLAGASSASPGTGTEASRSDHVHPDDRTYIDAEDEAVYEAALADANTYTDGKVAPLASSVNDIEPDGGGNVDLDYEVTSVAGIGNGVTNVTHDLLAALSGATQVDFTNDSDFDMAGGATLRSTGVGAGKFVSRAYPFGGSENVLTHVHVTAGFHATSATFVSIALYRPDGTTIPLAAPSGSGLGGPWTPSAIDVRFFGTGTAAIDIDVILATPEQFDEDDIQLGIAAASFAAGDPPTITASGEWHASVNGSVDRFADHLLTAAERGQLPVGTFYAKFGPFGDINMSATGDGSYAKTVGDMTDSRGGTHWTVVEGDGFFQYNQDDSNPDHNGFWTFHRPGTGDCYFTYDATQPSLPGTYITLEQGGDPIPGLDPAKMQQGGTVPGAGLEQQVTYYLRHITYLPDGSIAGLNINQSLPNPSLMWTPIAGEATFSDSWMVWFLDPTDGDVTLHMRAPDFSDGANVVQRLYYIACLGGTGNHAYLDTHAVEGLNPFEVPAGAGVIVYSDGSNWRVLALGVPLPPASGTVALQSIDGVIQWA